MVSRHSHIKQITNDRNCYRSFQRLDIMEKSKTAKDKYITRRRNKLKSISFNKPKPIRFQIFIFNCLQIEFLENV